MQVELDRILTERHSAVTPSQGGFRDVQQDVIAAVKAAKILPGGDLSRPFRAGAGSVCSWRWPTGSTRWATDQQRGAGHWLVQSTTPERVAEELRAESRASAGVAVTVCLVWGCG